MPTWWLCDVHSILQGLVDFDGYYLEHDPCLVCNNPEIPFAVCWKFDFYYFQLFYRVHYILRHNNVSGELYNNSLHRHYVLLWTKMFYGCKNCIVLQNIKLSSIKVDSKFTTTMQIVKLSGSHTISRITLKITDLKRAKMVSISRWQNM